MIELATKRQALVCGRWPFTLIGGEGGHYRWVKKNIRAVGHNALCQAWMLDDPQLRGLSVFEPFGGLGIASIIIKNLLKPSFQFVCEIDQDCLAQLRDLLLPSPAVSVSYGDAKKTLLDVRYFNIFILDFASYTIYRYEEWRKQWETIFDCSPVAVTWFDSSANYLHLHRERFGKVLGKAINDRGEYAQAVSEFMYDRHGYSIIKAAYEPHAHMVYFMAKPRPVGEITVFEPLREQTGFQFL